MTQQNGYDCIDAATDCELDNKETNFEANYDDKEDLKELLNLSNKKQNIANFNSWEKVLPLYPISPIN